MNKMSYLLYLLIAAFGFLGAAASKPEYSGLIFHELYSTQNHLEPHETLVLLKSLKRVYKSEDISEQDDQYDWKELIKRFVDVSDVKPEKCDSLSQLSGLRSLIQMDMTSQKCPNVGNYITHYTDLQFGMCKQRADNSKEIEKAVEDLSKKDRQTLQTLLDNTVAFLADSDVKLPALRPSDYLQTVIKMDTPEKDDLVAWAALRFLTQRANTLANTFRSNKGTTWLVSKYNKHLKPLCTRAADKLERLATIYLPFITGTFSEEVDSSTKQWVFATMICKRIISSDPDSVLSRAILLHTRINKLS